MTETEKSKPADISPWCHEHQFLGANQRDNEKRTYLVIALTAVTMVVEVAAGIIFGSMALLADGWHMASHAAAFAITAFGYWYARRHACDPGFSFGTGKVGDLTGYSSAMLLGGIALLMGYESVTRFFSPVAIAFDEAIAVAVLGLAVNIISAFLLRENHHGHHHAHDHDHDHEHSGEHHSDHNLRAAYLHVLADALTSVLAIAALTAGRFLGWVWMDPVMGLVGSFVIARWSLGLARDTGRVLLDVTTNKGLADKVRNRLESVSGVRVADLHVWRVGAGHFSAIISLVDADPRPPDFYKKALSGLDDLCHITVEINHYPNPDESGR